MGSRGNTWLNDSLKLLFNATAVANIADNAGASPLTDLYVSLHTGAVGASGSQTTNECAYGSYARVPVARSGAGWTVAGATVANAATISFPAATGGSETATHFAVGTDASGTGKVLYFGTLSAPRAITSGVTPQFAAGALTDVDS